jgi:hypothetical protein
MDPYIKHNIEIILKFFECINDKLNKVEKKLIQSWWYKTIFFVQCAIIIMIILWLAVLTAYVCKM